MILKIPKKKCIENFVGIFFLAKLISIFLESSETHFDLVTSKLGAKLNNLL